MTHAQRLPTGTDEEREVAVSAATLAVQRGDLVVIPTDTVYGIGADAFDADAVKALLDGQGPRPRHAAAGAGQRGDHGRRAGHRTSPATPAP